MTPAVLGWVNLKNQIHHSEFTEYIVAQTFSEMTCYIKEGKEREEAVTYDAHVGIMQKEQGRYVIFCNWDEFLAEYYLTADTARKILVNGTKEPPFSQDEEKLRESFRNYAPTLYNVLTDEDFPVKPWQGLQVGKQSLNAMAITVKAESEEAVSQSPSFTLLISTCLQICREISTTTHLAIWRRYLMGVWLHE